MHLAIIGTGKMGTAVFQWAVDRDLELTLCSRSAENLRLQEGRFTRKLERAVRRGDVTAEQAVARKATVHFTTRIADIAGVDFALESVPENMEDKVPILRAIEAAIGPKALVLTNTSFISLNRLAQTLQHPERFCGLHFFYPVMVIPLVEIIVWDGIQPDVAARLLNLCTVLGRPGMVVSDGPGSPLNWILACLYFEGLYLLEEGAALPDRVDQVARRYFSPGPCEAFDTLGLELVLQGLRMFTMSVNGTPLDWLRTDATEIPAGQAGGRVGFHVPWLFGELHKHGRGGRKASRGVFLYEGDKTLNDEPSFYLRPGNTARPLPDDEIAARLYYTVLNAALHCLSQRLCSAADLNRGLREVLLMEKGPLEIAHSLGTGRMRREMAELAEKYGSRFHPRLPLEEAGLA